MNGESVHSFSPLHHSFHSFTTHFIPNYWLQYSFFSFGFFFVHTREHFDCTPQHFSHSPAHLPPPYRHIAQTWAYRRRDKHSLNYPLFDTEAQKHIFWNHKAPSFFISALFATMETRMKRPAGGILVQQSGIAFRSIAAQRGPNPPASKDVRSVYTQLGAEHLLICVCTCVCMCVCVCVEGEVNDRC